MKRASSVWWVYLLRCADDTFYIGISTDVDKRLACHNAGRGAKYTRGRLPVICVWREKVGSESLAKQREAALKKLSREDKRKLTLT
ncbi:GIY-YIG nuclease family protein [Patescibacteria group bacterium]|nr:GIY-YIG nuclease family protein [Patescibacteria group bacterium]